MTTVVHNLFAKYKNINANFIVISPNGDAFLSLVQRDKDR